MKKKLFNVFLFTAGAAVGSLVTWKLVKNKYERIAQEEIDSVKETWARMMREESENNDSSESEEQDEDDPDDEFEDDDSFEYDQPTVTAYHEIASMYSKSGDKETENDEEGEEDQEEDVPYINGPTLILPEDFANGDHDYDLYSLTYYADGILADDWYKKYDVDETIGEDSVEHFGDYVTDVIHVRNERLHAEYEVTKDPRNYADMIHKDPLMLAYET